MVVKVTSPEELPPPPEDELDDELPPPPELLLEDELLELDEEELEDDEELEELFEVELVSLMVIKIVSSSLRKPSETIKVKL